MKKNLALIKLKEFADINLNVVWIGPFLYARRRRDVLWDHPWRAGGIPHSLSGAYLQNYTSYAYETS